MFEDFFIWQRNPLWQDMLRRPTCDQDKSVQRLNAISQEKILNNSSKKGDTVLDLFGGSGSTLIACEKKSRICYMLELSPEYVQVIIKRFYDVTGGTVEISCENREVDFTFLNS